MNLPTSDRESQVQHACDYDRENNKCTAEESKKCSVSYRKVEIPSAGVSFVVLSSN